MNANHDPHYPVRLLQASELADGSVGLRLNPLEQGFEYTAEDVIATVRYYSADEGQLENQISDVMLQMVDQIEVENWRIADIEDFPNTTLFHTFFEANKEQILKTDLSVSIENKNEFKSIDGQRGLVEVRLAAEMNRIADEQNKLPKRIGRFLRRII